MNSKAFGLVLPCYNYGRGFQRSLDRVASWKKRLGLNVLLCIVDDGSTDDSLAVARAFQAQNSEWCVVKESGRNFGKGHAVRLGVSALPASLPYIFFTDSDLHYGLTVITDRMLPLLEAGGDVVMLDRSWHRQFHSGSVLRKALSYSFIHLKTVLAAVPFEDSQAGLKGFRGEFIRDAVRVARVNGFAFDVEILSIAIQHRFQILQVPISLSGQPVAEGTSVTVGKAFRMFWDLLLVAANRYSGKYRSEFFYERISRQVYEIKNER